MKSIYFLLVCFLALSHLCGTEVDLVVSRNKVGLNESFTATYSTESKVDGQPDFTPLQSDFDILSKNQAFRTSIINGKMSQQNQWTLALMPKREGTLNIPSLSFGKSQSKSKTIEVIQVPESKQSETLYIETSISSQKNVYEQAPIIYSIRLYSSVNLVQGTISDVNFSDKDAIIEKLGNDTEFDHYDDDDTRYRVIERKYSVVPQHTGEYVFAPVQFHGKAMTGSRGPFFDLQTEFIRATSKQVKVEVKPIPAPFSKSNWFPAKDVKLTEEWSVDPSNIDAGEPITWTVTVTADGLLGSQIPTIDLSIPADVKAYFDKPQTENMLEANSNRGVKQVKVALIPTKSGTINIPELSIKWWDLNTDQVREVKIPSRKIEVSTPEVAINDNPEILIPPVTNELKVEQKIQSSDQARYFIFALIAFFSIIVSSICFLVFNRRNKKVAETLRQVKKELRKACKNNDPIKAATCLIQWGQQIFPEEKPLTVADLKKSIPVEMQIVINDLNRALYSPSCRWQGQQLWQQIDCLKIKKGSLSTKGEIKLKSLYP